MAQKEQLAVRLPAAALKMVDQLIGSVHGVNRAEVARALIIDQLKKLAAEGLVRWVVEPVHTQGDADT